MQEQPESRAGIRARPSAWLAAVALVLSSSAVEAQLSHVPEELLAPPTEAQVGNRRTFRRRMAEMLEAVQEHHHDTDVEDRRLVHGAIRGMLDTLDPHTHFLDSDSYRTMRESQDGSFHGLGIIISMRRDKNGKARLTVISPIDGMPARRLGVRPGDIIAAIDGESTEGLTLDGAVARLRGERGTSVSITIERTDESFDLTIERAQIPTESIQHAFMIRPGVGFVRIKDFTRTTTDELLETLEDLRRQGMERLVLDLRDNPGGLLDEAVTVSATFLETSQLVVETRGRVPGANETHQAPELGGSVPAEVPLVVLINRGSASASEIVAGAVQDHDRGLLLGTTTWGKGLVQSVYNLSNDCGLALTTARYYTPSGRQIQRDYRSSYYEYYFPRRDESPHGERHVTEGGRPVYSGGGIQPDVEVEARELRPLVARLIRRSDFFRFANHRHLEQHAGRVAPGYQVTPEDIRAFRAFLEGLEVEIDPGEWQEAAEDIALQLREEIVSAHLGLEEGFKVACEADPQVQAALELFPHATRTAILADAAAGDTLTVGDDGAEQERELAEARQQ